MTIEEPIWANEVKNATYRLSDLPATIEDEIIDYLKLELGPDFKSSLCTLKYIGEYELWGKPIRCWDYGNKEMYVTVQPYANNYYIGFTEKCVSYLNPS